MASLLEHSLNTCLGALAGSPQGKSAVRPFVRRLCVLLKWLARLCAGGYLAFLVLLWLALRYHGESNLTLAFLLYLPPAAWGLPLIALVPVVLVLDWRSLAFVVAGAGLMVFGFLGWRWHGRLEAPPGAPVLTLLTFNHGENRGSLEPFKNRIKPDVLVLQDCDNRAAKFFKAPGYEEFVYGDGIGEFVIASRHPIISKELIKDGEVAVAGRFTIEWQGRTVVIYSMHLPTPRHALASLYHGAFLWGILGVAGGPAAKARSYETWWEEQIAHARVLMAHVEKETLPCLLAGDSNAPAQGYIHHLLAHQFTDSHEAAGHGCGMSFPGATHNPLSLGGPWMRIDKILSSDAWQPLWNEAEPDRPSQHRSVAASFALLTSAATSPVPR